FRSLLSSCELQPKSWELRLDSSSPPEINTTLLLRAALAEVRVICPAVSLSLPWSASTKHSNPNRRILWFSDKIRAWNQLHEFGDCPCSNETKDATYDCLSSMLLSECAVHDVLVPKLT